MNAIVEISGKQFKVEKDSKLFVHRLEGKEGSKVTFDNVLFKGQNWLAQWIIKEDRGNYIRNLREYSSLFPQNTFSEIQFDLREDFLRIPYTHVISVCTK